MASKPKLLKMSEDASCSTIEEKKTKIPWFNFASSNFNDIVKMEAFVDKTLLIQTIFETTPMILITAPRRFGKSTNMDMVKKFVEIQADKNGAIVDGKGSSNYLVFKDKLISQDQTFFNKYFATYPVIYLDFKPVTGNSFEVVEDQFRFVLHTAFKDHPFLLNSQKLSSSEISKFEKYYDVILYCNLTRLDIETGLRFLSECLYKHFDKEVFVLIDEYDAPINNTMFKQKIEITDVNGLLTTILSNTLKSNQYVERALLTGISYFATVGLSALNNIEKCMFLDDHPFVQYYGLTELEVAKLLTKFNIEDDLREKVKLHYNGYISLKGVKLYSIWSILHFLKKMVIRNFWEESGLVTNLKEALNFPIVRYHIEKICERKSVVIKILHKVVIDDIIKLQKVCLQKADSQIAQLEVPDLYLSFILQQGYLTYERKGEVDNKLYAVKAPNDEIVNEFKEKLRQYYTPSTNSYFEKCAVIFNKISPSSDDDIFKDFITKFNTMLSKLDYKIIKKNEDTYHCLMFNILCKTNFSLATEAAFSGGRTDLILYKECLGIIIEMKYRKSSIIALKQIIDRYLRVFNEEPFQNITQNIYIGLNVSENNTADMSVLVDNVDVRKAKCF